MKIYGNAWVQMFGPDRRLLRVLLGRPLTWAPHSQRLSRSKNNKGHLSFEERMKLKAARRAK